MEEKWKRKKGKIMGGEAEGQSVTGMDNKQKERGWVGTRSGPHYGRAGKLRFETTAAEGEREREKRKGKREREEEKEKERERGRGRKRPNERKQQIFERQRQTWGE